MKYTTFNAEVKKDRSIQIPAEIQEKLSLQPGDTVYVNIKKVKTKRLEAIIKENPLYKLIDFAEK